MVDEVTTIAGETGDAPPPEVTAATPVPVEGDEKAEATPSGGERGSSAKTPTEEDAAGEGEGGKEASGNDNGAGESQAGEIDGGEGHRPSTGPVALDAEKSAKQDTEEGETRELSEEARKIVVLGLPYSLTEGDLWRHMRERFGVVQKADLIMDKTTGRSKGFAFVTFADGEQVKKAVEASGTFEIDGRRIDIKLKASKGPGEESRGQKRDRDAAGQHSFQPPPPTHRASLQSRGYQRAVEQNQNLDRRIFVAKIAPDLEGEVVRGYFASFGEIEDFHMPRQGGTHCPHRGIAFVSFANGADAERALETREHIVQPGCAPLAVDRAKSRQPGGGRGPRGGYGGPRPGYGMGGGYTRHVDAVSNAHVRLFVGKLPPQCTEDELRAHFSQFGVIHQVTIPRDAQTGRERNFGFVTFADPSSLSASFSVPEHVVRPGTLPVAVDQATPPRSSMPQYQQPPPHLPYSQGGMQFAQVPGVPYGQGYYGVGQGYQYQQGPQGGAYQVGGQNQFQQNRYQPY